MTQKMKFIAGVAAFALVIAGAVFAYNTLTKQVQPEIGLAESQGSFSKPTPSAQENGASQEESAPGGQENMKAPDFTVEDADGNSVKLSDMEGKPVVLNFWASWCPPCKAEMPEFDTVYAEFGEDVIFMMVNMTDGRRETKEEGAAYVADHGFSFPVYYDTKQEAANAYAIRAIPTTMFIDKDGYIITGAEGQIDEKTLRYGVSLIQDNKSDEGVQEIKTAEYRKITAEEAYKMMSETEAFILLDVRTDEEYKEERIDGAILIPDYEIKDRAESELPDKNALILVYCRSGRRSVNAANELINMGYTNVYDFGGIIDWTYDTVSS